MSKSEKITQFVIVICIAAIITAVGNVMDGKHLFGDSLIGVAVLAGLATIGAMISYLPYANKFPMVFWVSLVGVIASLPGMPGQEWIIAKTSQVTFLATTTPVLAYAGLSLGKRPRCIPPLVLAYYSSCLSSNSRYFHLCHSISAIRTSPRGLI